MADFPTDDAETARIALRSILADPTAPAAAKASAARTLAEMAGAIGRLATPPGDDLPNVFEMSRADISAELAGIGTRKRKAS